MYTYQYEPWLKFSTCINLRSLGFPATICIKLYNSSAIVSTVSLDFGLRLFFDLHFCFVFIDGCFKSELNICTTNALKITAE